MADLLLYQTSDPQFADRAVEALEVAGIPSYRTGSGYVELARASRSSLGLGVCIFLRREEDYRRANEILIKLGAAIEGPPKLPSRRMLFLWAMVLTLLALVVAINSNMR